jgi:hypothetical protein
MICLKFNYCLRWLAYIERTSLKVGLLNRATDFKQLEHCDFRSQKKDMVTGKFGTYTCLFLSFLSCSKYSSDFGKKQRSFQTKRRVWGRGATRDTQESRWLQCSKAIVIHNCDGCVSWSVRLFGPCIVIPTSSLLYYGFSASLHHIK